MLHFGSKTTKEIAFHLSFQNEVNQYSLTLSPTDDDSLFPPAEFALYWNKAYPQPYSNALQPAEKRREAGISSTNLGHDVARWVRAMIFA